MQVIPAGLPGSTLEHDNHTVDTCFGCFDSEKKVRYVFVGEHKGRYKVSSRETYYYVGPHNGSYEQEDMPEDHTMQCVCICLAVFIFFSICAFLFRHFTMIPLFDCDAGLDNHLAGWSGMKRSYCCDAEGKGCIHDWDPNHPIYEMPDVPRWLRWWWPEMQIGTKLVVVGLACLMTGLFCGCCNVYLCLRYQKPTGQTEEDLYTYLDLGREHHGAAKEGEIVITMTWDTKDELDLQLELPDERIICYKCPEIAGGVMDINRNRLKLHGGKLKWPAVESIHWDYFDPYSSDNPPNGHYKVWARVLHKRDHHKDTNLTVSRLVDGKGAPETKMYHRRIPPGTREVFICEFNYQQPRALNDKEKEMIKVHKHYCQEHNFHSDDTGPLVVSMVWDTKDVIDLQVKMPGRGGKRCSMDGSAHSHHEVSGAHGRSYVSFKTAPAGLYELRAVVREKMDSHDAHITVVANMQGKRKTFHQKIEGESSCFVGVLMFKP